MTECCTLGPLVAACVTVGSAFGDLVLHIGPSGCCMCHSRKKRIELVFGNVCDRKSPHGRGMDVIP